MADQPTKPSHLEPSKLGTKQYWDALYATELTNHASNPSDEGTVWFDDSSAEEKIIYFLDRHFSSPSSPLQLSKPKTTFLDLGCGNGSLLFALRDAGWEGRLLGVDYSEASVALAVKVGAARRARELGEQEQDEDGEDGMDGTEGEAAVAPEEKEGMRKKADRQASFVTTGNGNAHNNPITAPAPEGKTVDFMVWDVLAGPISAVAVSAGRKTAASEEEEERKLVAGWDVVLDKGTFDAVSLSDEKDENGRRICEGYRGRVLRLLRTGGVFLVTSCNWTEAELKGWFESDGEKDGPEGLGRLEMVDRVEYRSFSFGGVKGQTISTACFMKKGEVV